MGGLQVYGLARRVGRVTERGRGEGSYLQRRLWHRALLCSHFKAKKDYLFTQKLCVFPFGSPRAFSLSMQRHCIFRVKHMRMSYELRAISFCISPSYLGRNPISCVLFLCCSRGCAFFGPT